MGNYCTAFLVPKDARDRVVFYDDTYRVNLMTPFYLNEPAYVRVATPKVIRHGTNLPRFENRLQCSAMSVEQYVQLTTKIRGFLDEEFPADAPAYTDRVTSYIMQNGLDFWKDFEVLLTEER